MSFTNLHKVQLDTIWDIYIHLDTQDKSVYSDFCIEQAG